MKILLENREIATDLFQVPEMNYGQMQRWKDHSPLQYSIEIETTLFLERFEAVFSEFRENELEEEDDCNLPELIHYRKAGRPHLKELFYENTSLLKDLLIYHQYEILHLIIRNPIVGSLFYSINSIDDFEFKSKTIVFSGICFKVVRT